MNNNDPHPSQQDVILATLLKSFMHDPSVIILDKVPYFDADQFAKRRYINYVIVTNAEDPVTIAILIKPARVLEPEENEKFEAAVKTLSRLKWIPVIFTEDDFWLRFSKVKKHLQAIISSYQKKSLNKEAKKLNSSVSKPYRSEEQQQLPKKIKFS